MADEFDDRFDDKDMKGTLNAWRESAEKQADRPDWFWARQRALISSRIQEPQPRRVPALALSERRGREGSGGVATIRLAFQPDYALRYHPSTTKMAGSEPSLFATISQN